MDALIQLIFTTIRGFHYTFWYYLWITLYYFNYLLALFIVFSTKNFQFQLKKPFLTDSNSLYFYLEGGRESGNELLQLVLVGSY